MNRSFRKKYLCIASVLMIMAFASTAMASYPRITSMGLEKESVWMIQKDETYITLNPAYLAKFTPQIFVNLVPNNGDTTTVHPLGGIFLNPMDSINMAITTGQDLPNVSYGFPSENLTTDQDLTREQFNLALSYDMGDMAFGFSSAFAFTNYKADDTDDFNYRKYAILTNLGFLMDLGSGMSADGALNLTTWKIMEEATGDELYKALNMDIDALGRFNYALSEANTLHAFGRFTWINRSADGDYLADEIKDKYYLITVGLSDEINVTKSSLVYVGGYVKWAKDNPDGNNDTARTAFDISMGVETNLTDNLKGRFGAHRTWFYGYQNYGAAGDPISDTEVEEGIQDPSDSSSNYEVHTGLGYKLGNVLIDWEIALDILTDGPYFISGATGTQWSTEFALTYFFETGNAAAAPAPVKKIR